MQLRPDLTMVGGRPGQAHLLRRDAGGLLVDTGRRGQTAGVEEELARRGLGRDVLTHVVLTHWHPDHAGSAAEIGSRPGVTDIHCSAATPPHSPEPPPPTRPPRRLTGTPDRCSTLPSHRAGRLM